MIHRLHLFPGFTLLLATLAILVLLSWWVWRSTRGSNRSIRAVLVISDLLLAMLFSLTYLLGFHRILRHVPMWHATWIEALGLMLSIGIIGLFCGVLLWRLAPAFKPERRAFIKAAGVACVAVPYVATAAGIIYRKRIHLNTVDIAIPNLPRDLHGLRIAQISDIHLSPFLSERDFARVVDMANEAKPHLTLVTGDLITRPGDPLDACLRQLARLRADAGVLGCLGNHEVYCECEDYVDEHGRAIGIDFLRGRARMLRFGNTNVNFAGVDYQQFDSPYLAGAEHMVVADTFNVLLSHNPDVFPVAASQGYDLTIAGHTHGGQLNIEILHQDLNVARFFTPYVRGLYRQDKSAVYVSSGVGTIGVPVRIGAPAEVALIRLCAS